MPFFCASFFHCDGAALSERGVDSAAALDLTSLDLDLVLATWSRVLARHCSKRSPCSAQILSSVPGCQ